LSLSYCHGITSRKFIAQPTDDDLKKFPEKGKHLIKKGREQRYVTHQEIIAAVPNAEENVDMLDEIYTLFVDLGIQVIDVKDALLGQEEQKRHVAGGRTHRGHRRSDRCRRRCRRR